MASMITPGRNFLVAPVSAWLNATSLNAAEGHCWCPPDQSHGEPPMMLSLSPKSYLLTEFFWWMTCVGRYHFYEVSWLAQTPQESSWRVKVTFPLNMRNLFQFQQLDLTCSQWAPNVAFPSCTWLDPPKLKRSRPKLWCLPTTNSIMRNLPKLYDQLDKVW